MAEQNSSEFLLTEYETLRELRQDLVRVGENRLNFYLVLISGVALLIGFLADPDTEIPTLTRDLLIGVIVSGTMCFGLFTFTRMIHRHIQIANYSRGLNLIRKYFVKQNAIIQEYLMLPSDDNHILLTPETFLVFLKDTRGLIQSIMLVNSILVAAMVILIASKTPSLQEDPTFALVLFTIGATLVSYGLHAFFYYNQLKRAETRMRSATPKVLDTTVASQSISQDALPPSAP